jgi:pimeloyl-ACP methyl ester carboxylesterase
VATYALIPGGGGDPWDWHRVVPELRARGHDTVPVALPAGDDSAGWSDYADAVTRAVGDRKELVVVAHSLGGFTAPLVCVRLPVELLVLVNAMIPAPTETGSEWGSNTRLGDASREYLRSIGLPEDTEDDAVIYYHDFSPDLAAEAAKHTYPNQSMTPMEQPWPLAAWPDVPTRVLVGHDDRLFPASFQQRVARERLGIDPEVIDGGHMLALSHPRELVERLEAYRVGLPVALRRR